MIIEKPNVLKSKKTAKQPTYIPYHIISYHAYLLKLVYTCNHILMLVMLYYCFILILISFLINLLFIYTDFVGFMYFLPLLQSYENI